MVDDYGTVFDGKHSYKDFGFRVKDKKIGTPSKIKTKERIAYSNKIFDFSTVYGGQEYNERELVYVYSIRDRNKTNLDVKLTSFIKHLTTPSQKVILKDDVIPGYYFFAEVEGPIDLDEFSWRGDLTVTYTAYPFRVSDSEEGNDIWDSFNFLLDYAQPVQFTIQNHQSISLFNGGVTIAHPTIRSSAPMQLIFNGRTFNIPAGESSSLDFYLQPGDNSLQIVGTGTISFHFRKELI